MSLIDEVTVFNAQRRFQNYSEVEKTWIFMSVNPSKF